MKTLEHFRVALQPETTEGTILARVVPYGAEIAHNGRRIVFDADSISIPPGTLIPLTVDHGDGVTERIGKLEAHAQTDEGLFAELTISETRLGQDVRRLLLDGVLTDVSAGVEIDATQEFQDADGVLHRSGTLDHVSIVAKGAFGDAGSKILAVHGRHDEGRSTVAEEKKEVETPKVETDQYATKDDFDRVEKMIAKLSLPGAIKDVSPKAFADKRDFVLTLAAASRGDSDAQKKIEKYQLADDTTTTSAGVVPDFLSQEVISVLDTTRPYLDAIDRDPIGNAGMSVVYPKVNTKPIVDVQAAEKTLVPSQSMTIVPDSFDLVTYAGASDVSRQLIERSQPSFVDILFREYASAYAQKTDGDAIDAGVVGAGGTAVLADLGADAAATFAAVSVGNTAIIAGTRRPASHWGLAADRWEQLNSLVDSDGRPLLVFPQNGPQNAQGQSSFVTTVAQYHGLVAYLDPNASTGAALLHNSAFSAYVEQSPVQLRAEVVSLLGFEMGVFGLFAHVLKIVDGGYSLTVA